MIGQETAGGSGGSGSSGRFVVAVVAPIFLVAIAYALWWISNELVIIGPLDRAQFGWLVVVPLVVIAPVAGGFVLATLGRREATAAMVLAGAVFGLCLALVFWRSVADPGCPSGNIRTPADWIVPSLILGAAYAASVTVSGLVTAGLVRDGRRVVAVVGGILVDLLLLAGVLVVAGIMIVQPMCNRPGTIG